MQKAKERQKFKAKEPTVTGGGMRFAPLEGGDKGREPEINVVSRAPTASTALGIPTGSTGQPMFTNSSNQPGGNFAPLERSKQDLMA